jgi:hypothetical protein
MSNVGLTPPSAFESPLINIDDTANVFLTAKLSAFRVLIVIDERFENAT